MPDHDPNSQYDNLLKAFREKKGEAVSVRGGMLAILTLGPAYGSQLLGEFQRRAAHRPIVNVGQAYTTLDRLTKQGLVQPAGKTDDGLILFALTEAGQQAADAWLRHAPESTVGDDWEEMLDRVLIARSLPDHSYGTLIDSYIESWTKRTTGQTLPENADFLHGHDARSLAVQADALVARAALDWLQRVSDTSATAVAYSTAKPRRGRRPLKVAD